MKPGLNHPHTRLRDGDLRALSLAPKGVEAIRPDGKKRTVRATLVLYWQRYRERKQMRRDLVDFTDEVFKDFGLSREQAIAMANKPFWRA
jgi:uncharacterized protein YjiS (DUF1127 family)